MAYIKEIQYIEMEEIMDFYNLIKNYGHIFYDDPKVLDEPFKQIMEGMEKVTNIIDDNYSH